METTLKVMEKQEGGDFNDSGIAFAFYQIQGNWKQMLLDMWEIEYLKKLGFRFSTISCTPVLGLGINPKRVVGQCL
jgi:hypothetical protein